MPLPSSSFITRKIPLRRAGGLEIEFQADLGECVGTTDGWTLWSSGVRPIPGALLQFKGDGNVTVEPRLRYKYIGHRSSYAVMQKRTSTKTNIKWSWRNRDSNPGHEIKRLTLNQLAHHTVPLKMKCAKTSKNEKSFGCRMVLKEVNKKYSFFSSPWL